MNIRKICEYSHDKYLHRYKNGDETNIYSTSKIRESHYLYFYPPICIPVEYLT